MTDDRRVGIAGLQLHSFFELVLESIPAGLVYGNPSFEIKNNHAPAPTRYIGKIRLRLSLLDNTYRVPRRQTHAISEAF